MRTIAVSKAYLWYQSRGGEARCVLYSKYEKLSIVAGFELCGLGGAVVCVIGVIISWYE